MSSHTYYIQAHNSKVAEKLNKILKQFDAFKHTLTGFSNKDEADFLKSFFIENEMIEPFNLKLPLLQIPVDDINAMKICEHPALDVFLFIQYRLMELGACKNYIYFYRQDKRPVLVMVWKEDVKNLSKYLLKKLIPISATTL